MPQYKDRQSVLDEALGEYIEQGFSLKEQDDHILELYFKDKVIGVFSQLGATIPSIRAYCETYLESMLITDLKI